MNFTDAIIEHARRDPWHPAIEERERVVSYAELAERMEHGRMALEAAGVRPGDLVAIQMPSTANQIIALCAVIRARGVILSIDPRDSREDKRRNVTGLGARFQLCRRDEPAFEGLVAIPPDHAIGDVPPVTPTAAGDTADDEPLMCVQSSGTTGVPKSFLRSQEGMREWVRRYRENFRWDTTSRMICMIKLFFNVGRNSALGMLHSGGTVILPPVGRPQRLIRFARRKRATHLWMTPAHLRDLLAVAPRKGPAFPDMRAIVVGAAPTQHAERVQARRRLSPNFYEMLGINEVGVVAVAPPADQDLRPDTVGRVVEGLEVQVVDEHDRILPPGEVGRLRIRGSYIPSSYIADPEATARCFRDGWFHPGDLISMDGQGYVTFKGRVDDVINLEGVKFYPREVETILRLHPDIRDAVVFSIPDPRFGQVPAAALVTSRLIRRADLMEHFDRHGAAYKCPRIILAMREIPRDPMGKPLKKLIAERLQQRRRKEKGL